MTAWLIEALFASTVLMLLVLALRGPVARRFGAHAAYLLWLLPALRMVLPRVSLPAETPIAPIPVQIDLTGLMAKATAAPDTLPTIASSSAPTIQAVVSPFSWSATLLTLWLLGAAVHLAWQLGRYHRFMALAQEFGGRAHRRWGVSIRLSSAVPGPIAAGLFHRTVFLPTDYADRYDRSERRLVLAHEIAHHRRGDLIANAVALVVLSLHWFNPVAYLAYRSFRADQELACDATVVTQTDGARPAYGSALLKSAVPSLDREPTLAVACGMSPAAEMLKLRMTMLTRPCSRIRRAVGTGISALTVLAGLSVTASGCFAAPAKAAEAVRRPLATLAQGRLQLASFDATPRHVHDDDATCDEDNVTAAVAGPKHKKMIVAAALPAAPAPALPPAPPVPPVAAVPPLSPAPAERIAEAQAAAAAARAAAAEARADAHVAATHARAAARAAAAARVDASAIVREVHAQVRAELGRVCMRSTSVSVHGDHDDDGATGRITATCIDRGAIRRQIRDSLRQSRAEIARADIDHDVRDSVMSALDQASERLEHELR